MMYSFILLSLVVAVYCHQPVPELYDADKYEAKVKRLDEVEELIDRVTTRIQNLKDKRELRQKQKDDADRRSKSILLRLDRMKLNDGSFHCDKPDKEFKCRKNTQCVNNILVCDNVPDCEDKSDEDPDLCTHWDYHDIPGWAADFPTCGNGTSQSPIDIITSNVVTLSGNDPVLTINTGVTATGTLKNNGHTIQLDFAAGRYTLSDGNLGGTYLIDQLHFHWGSVDSQGSEHEIDGYAFPIEMHVVSHRNNYASLTAAVKSGNANALAVLGFLFEITWGDDDDDDVNNTNLNPITDKLSSIGASGSTTSVTNFDLDDLIKDAFKKPFYRYSGGLTTPPCSEVVVWTVFDITLGISSTQLTAFRNTGIVDNFRPTQSLNGRTVTLRA